jgi:hypothetical protein
VLFAANKGSTPQDQEGTYSACGEKHFTAGFFIGHGEASQVILEKKGKSV